MDQRQWQHINHFHQGENWGDLDLLKFELVQKLDWMREELGSPVFINCAADLTGHSTNSYHYKGMAADIHFSEDVLLGDVFILATRWFSGIGLYPFWNNPGLHVDIRSLKVDEEAKYWISWRKGKYHKLDINELSICHCKALRDQCLLMRDDDE